MYVVEPAPSPTGGMADHRIVLRASEIEAFAWDLTMSLGEGAKPSGKFKEVAAIARDLAGSPGDACLVIAGRTSRRRCMRWRTP